MTVQEFNQSVDDYSDRLFRFVLKSMKDRHMAEDIVQESFEKMWKNRENIDGSKVKSYLFTTAYHTMIDKLRKEKRMVATEEIPSGAMEHTSQYSDLKERLDEAVQRLPEVQRMVLVLRDFEGYSYQEIGQMCELGESQVKVYIYRARVFLKNYIGNLEVLV